MLPTLHDGDPARDPFARAGQTFEVFEGCQALTGLAPLTLLAALALFAFFPVLTLRPLKSL